MSKDACICYPCSKQLKRNVGNKNFLPRWHPRQSDKPSCCSITGCKQAAKKRTQITLNEAEKIFKKPVAMFEVTDEEDIVCVRLCTEHYNTAYMHTHTPSSCAACNSKPRKGERFNRRCSSVDVINTYLRLVSNVPCHLTDESIICHSCYKHFLIISRNKNKIYPIYLLEVSRSLSETNLLIEKLNA